MGRFRALTLAALLAVAACNGGAGVRISTRSMAPGETCALGLFGGKLAVEPSSGLGLDTGHEAVAKVWWPSGWTARSDAAAGVGLIDPQGEVVAHVGDQISVGGGYGADGWLHACAVGRSPADVIG